MSIDRRDPRLDHIVDADAERETLGSGFGFLEGPIWHPRGKHLTFSDIPGNRLHRYSATAGFSVYREPSNMANGNTYDGDGRMLSCEHATSRVVRERSGELEVLASHYQGTELNSPNDIVVAYDGAIYFTDPTYGRQARHGVERPPQLGFQGVYRIDPNGDLALLAGDFEQPNGLCLGLDGTTLFVADTTRRHVRLFAFTGNHLSGGDVFCESPAPDGLKLDAQGNLYAGGPEGVYVYDRDDGGLLGVLRTPEFCANFTWGDDNLQSLYLTASTGLYRYRVNVPGLPLM
ncbi:MAG: SMP-30/gluconolactonase/LRE family protein [Pseudomonadales bacterium]